SASTAARSSTSPCRYSALRRPSSPGSNGRRAIPITRPTARERSQARRNARPMSPVGPVTATVIDSVAIAGLSREHDPRDLALDDDPGLDRLDHPAVGPVEQRGGGIEARHLLERLDRGEDELELAALEGA